MMGRSQRAPMAADGASTLYGRYGKRVFDVAVAAPALILLSPLLALVAILVRLDSPGPVWLCQERLGRRGVIFRAYKFRTMIDRPRVSDHEILAGDAEVTRLGYWLRRFKLDELPQLVNVLTGDMSTVGPRPALPLQMAQYDATARKRLLVRPGLTGRAQVAGNIHLSWPERWHYDALYVENLSFRLDLRIIARTAAVLLLGEHKFLEPPDM
jgi:undecaprenyl phosphate N,N'-diacetylbacillosamine 1-phosphate transferase